MQRTFEAQVNTYVADRELDGKGAWVTFVGLAGSYYVREGPSDLQPTLRAALSSGRPVKVTVDARSLEITDVLSL